MIGKNYEDRGNKIFVRNKDIYGHGVTLSDLEELNNMIQNRFMEVEVELFAKGGHMADGGTMARGGQTRPNINGEANVTDIVAPKNYRGPDGDMGIALIIRLDYGHFANEVNLTEDKKMMYEKFRQDKETLRQFDMEFKSYSSDREGPYIEIIKIDGEYATIKALNKYVNVFNVKNKYKLATGGLTNIKGTTEPKAYPEAEPNTNVVV
jgi:hypothetical protein